MMTNLEYMRNLDAEELVAFIYKFFVPHGLMYSYTELGQVEWLKEAYKEGSIYNQEEIDGEIEFLRQNCNHEKTFHTAFKSVKIQDIDHFYRLETSDAWLIIIVDKQGTEIPAAKYMKNNKTLQPNADFVSKVDLDIFEGWLKGAVNEDMYGMWLDKSREKIM